MQCSQIASSKYCLFFMELLHKTLPWLCNIYETFLINVNIVSIPHLSVNLIRKKTLPRQSAGLQVADIMLSSCCKNIEITGGGFFSFLFFLKYSLILWLFYLSPNFFFRKKKEKERKNKIRSVSPIILLQTRQKGLISNNVKTALPTKPRGLKRSRLCNV